MPSKFYSHFILLCLLTTNALAGQTTRVSVASKGTQASTGGNLPRISADGRIVAFISRAPNLVPGDTNGGDDFFVHDRQTKQTTRVSVSSTGAQGTGGYIGYNFGVHTPSLSADGRYVAFASRLNNLVAGDISGYQDVFVHDRVTHQTRSISMDTSGVSGFSDTTPSISADGRYVAFISLSRYVAQDTNNGFDAYVYDRVTRKIGMVSISSSGVQGNQNSSGTSISADGRYVAFSSAANNLVAGDTTTSPKDLFVHDRVTHKTTRVNISSSGVQANGGVDETFSLSADGRYVAFSSGASNLVPGDTNRQGDIFIHDRTAHQTTRVSVGINGTQSNANSGYPSITPDGRYVAFVSFASNLIVGDTYGNDIFVYDRLTKKTTLSSVDSNGAKGYGSDGLPSINSDGRTIAFPSDAKLVAGDSNNAIDVFVRDSQLDTVHHADLKITTTIKPVSLKLNSNGAFTYTITNNGPDAVNNVSVLHLITSGGTTVSLIPSQGSCSLSAIETVCSLGKLLAGKSLTIQAVIKATGNPLSQQVSVSGEPVDAVPSNNSISVSTTAAP